MDLLGEPPLPEKVEERGLDDVRAGTQRGLVDGLLRGEVDERLRHVCIRRVREKACGGLLESKRKLYSVPQRNTFAFWFSTKVCELQVNPPVF